MALSFLTEENAAYSSPYGNHDNFCKTQEMKAVNEKS
jgi:hypothetical protein